MNPIKYEILTPDGWSDFQGIKRNEKVGSVKITTDNGKHLEGTKDHKVYTEKGFVFIKDILVGDKVFTENGYETVDSVYVNNFHSNYFYDALEVSKKNSYFTNGILSHNCEFLGSSNTLIKGSKLKTMVYENPIASNAGLDQYKKPEKDRIYTITVDVARGTNNDYSAFVVFDVTEVPYRIVAKYRDNSVKPLIFPNKIYDVARAYNQAYILVEINDIGEQVGNALHYDLQYDNVIMAASRGRSGQVLGQGFSGTKTQMGVKTTKTIKATGCSNLRQLIEDDKLIINDFDLINEFSSFVLHGQTYKAEEGCNDDLAMCCVIFAWMVDQTYFKELTDVDIRAKMYAEQQRQLEEDMSPFGFISTGLEDENIGGMVDEYGTRWTPVVRSYDTDW